MRLAQIHESFRTAELRALAVMAGTEIEIVRYDDDVGVSLFSPFLFDIFLLQFFWIRQNRVKKKKRRSERAERTREGISGGYFAYTYRSSSGLASHLALPLHHPSFGSSLHLESLI